MNRQRIETGDALELCADGQSKSATLACGVLVMLLIFTVNPRHGLAQTTSQLDSLLESARRDIYDNPLKTIEVATDVYNRKTASVNQRIRALGTISVGYSALRNYEKSLEFAFSADSLAAINPDLYWRVKTLNAIGARYQNLQIFNKSIQYLDSARALIDDLDSVAARPALLGYNYGIRGFIYREQMSCDVALESFDKSIYNYNQLDSEWLKNSSLSIIIYNKANCLLNLGHADSARKEFETSKRLAGKIKAKSLEAFAMKGIARVETFEGNFKNAVEILDSALSIAADAGDRELFEGLYNELAVNYEATGNWDMYHKYRRLYLKTHREVDKSVRKSVNESLRANMNSLYKLTEKKGAYLSWSFRGICLIIFCVLIFAAIDFRRYLIRKKRLMQEIDALKAELRKSN